MKNPVEIKRMIEFVEMPYTEEWNESIRKTFDEERVDLSVKSRVIDNEIETLLKTL